MGRTLTLFRDTLSLPLPRLMVTGTLTLVRVTPSLPRPPEAESLIRSGWQAEVLDREIGRVAGVPAERDSLDLVLKSIYAASPRFEVMLPGLRVAEALPSWLKSR